MSNEWMSNEYRVMRRRALLVRNHGCARYSFATMVALVTLIGCDLFSTRAPEPPSNANTFIWTPATTVEILMSNFTGALQAFDASNYIRAFITSTDSTGSAPKTFTFTPVAGLDPSSRSIFTNWSVDGPSESERAWLAKLSTLPHTGPLSVTLGAIAPVQTPNTASLTTSYAIALPSGVITGDTVRGSFEMQFVLVTTEQGTKEWRIVSWSDFPSSSGTPNATWTDLKVKLSS